MGNNGEKIGRNELCPCGSGEKYKKCCGKEKNPLGLEDMLKMLYCIAAGLKQQKILPIVRKEVLENMPEDWAEKMKIKEIKTPDNKDAYRIEIEEEDKPVIYLPDRRIRT